MPRAPGQIGEDRRIARVVEPAIERLRAEVEERVREYRRGRPRTSAGGRTAIVVDNGLATAIRSPPRWRSLPATGRTG